MPTSKPSHIRLASWAVSALEMGVLLFLGGLLLLYLNPFWHFDEGGFLDWRVHWWNAAGEILAAAGLVIEVLALIGSAAMLVSRLAKRNSWPYFVAVFMVLATVVWIGTEGFITNLNAHFEWNAADGLTVFRLQAADGVSEIPPDPQNALWKSLIQVQIQPMLRGYFRVNDWQKMNGDIGLKVVRAIPVAWPVGLGSGGETLQDPDETALMRAAEQQDLKVLLQLLPTLTRADVNALDQSGQTALILACQNPKARAGVVNALLAAGADVNLRARNGYAPLTWALARNNTEVARILRRAGAKP
jgi:Ankyrin repeats (3 copies)